MGAETSQALLLGRQHSCCLHTLSNPAFILCVPSQDCVLGQGLVSLGISLTEPCFWLVQEQEIDCLFNWDENPRYEVNAEMCQPGSSAMPRDSRTALAFCTTQPHCATQSLHLVVLVLLSSLLWQMSRKQREGAFLPVYRLRVIRNRKVACLFSKDKLLERQPFCILNTALEASSHCYWDAHCTRYTKGNIIWLRCYRVHYEL